MTIPPKREGKWLDGMCIHMLHQDQGNKERMNENEQILHLCVSFIPSSALRGELSALQGRACGPEVPSPSP